MNWILSLLWGIAAAGLAWHTATIARQITYVTLADGRRQERRLPLSFRVLLPLAPNLAPLFARNAFAAIHARLARQIVAAGCEGLVTAQEILALRILMPAVLGPLWLAAVYAMLLNVGSIPIARFGMVLYVLGPVWLFLYPGLWLKHAVTARHMSMRRSLPFVLDVLTLSVEAGMDFMTALRRHVETRRVDALGEELIRTVREIQLGKTRREALRDMSRRVDLADLRSVVNALVQADELGVSIGTILRIQADQIRQRRFERAERLAHEAPVKLLAPLLLFIFPSVFLILMGPIIARLIQQGF